MTVRSLGAEELAIEDLSLFAIPETPDRIQAVTVSFRVRNLGMTATRSPVRVAMSTTAPDVLGVRDRLVVAGPLKGAGKFEVSHTLRMPTRKFAVTVNASSGSRRQAASAEAVFANPNPNVGRWVSLGPTLINEGIGASGRVTTIAIDPRNPTTIYAGALSGNPAAVGGSGLWKTMDGGATWAPITDSLPSLKVGAVALEPGLAQRVYVTVWNRAEDSATLYRSDDGGGTWAQISDDAALRGRALLIDPSLPARMFMSTAAGCHRSVDGGVTWQTNLSFPGARVSDLAMDPAAPTRLLAGVWHATDGTVAGVYETTDSGTTWRKLTGCPDGPLPANLAGWTTFLAIGKGRIYAAFKSSSPAEWVLYRTINTRCLIGGQSEQAWQQGWVAGSAIAPTMWSYIYVHPGDPDIVYATGTRFRRSTDGGASFAVMDGPHVDHHAFAVDPRDSKVVYAGSDGGIYRSNDRGATNTWSFVGQGMANTEFYDLAQANTDERLVIGGTQDNGTLGIQPAGTVWDWIRDGDGGSVAVDPTDKAVLYSMNQYASSISQQRNGASWQPLNANLPMGSTCFNLHFGVHPTIPTTMLASCTSLWRTETTTPPGDWQSIFPPAGFPAIDGGVVRSAVDAHLNLYYAATSRGELYAGVGGTGWERVFSVIDDCGEPAAGITDIAVDVDEPGSLYVSLAADDACRVIRLRRADPRELRLSIEDITANLPVGTRVSALAIDLMNRRTIYAGTTDRAVFRGRSSTTGAWVWDSYGNGLPFATCIQRLLVHPITGVLRAGTCGRGAFEVNTDHPIGSLLAIEGIPIYLRVHEAGGYGPPNDRIEGEVVVRLDTDPLRAFGFELRTGTGEGAHVGMLRLLRSAFATGERVRIEYYRTGIRNGRAIRVMHPLEPAGRKPKRPDVLQKPRRTSTKV